MYKLWLYDKKGEFAGFVYADTAREAGQAAREWLNRHERHDCAVFKKNERGTWNDDGARVLRAA